MATLKRSSGAQITRENPPRFVILSHLEFDNQVFKLHNNMPARFASIGYLPKVLVESKEFVILSNTQHEQWWRGNGLDAKMLINECIAAGAKPLILDYRAALLQYARHINTKYKKAFPPGRQRSIQTDIMIFLEGKPEYQGLYELFCSVQTMSTRGDLHMSEHHVNQLLEVLGIIMIKEPEKRVESAFDPYAPPPKGMPLIDMSEYTATDEDIIPKGVSPFPLGEQGEPILPPEYANIEPNFGQPVSKTYVPSSIAFGKSKGEKQRENRTRRKK